MAVGKCTLYNCTTKKTFTCQFNPEDLPRGRSVNYSSIKSPGMAYPLTQYTSGDVEEFDINLFFHDIPYSGIIKIADDFMNTLIPPSKNTKKFVKPPVVTLVYGTFTCNVVVTKKAITEEWRDENGNPTLARYTLSVRRI